jgi:hypothetical protein
MKETLMKPMPFLVAALSAAVLAACATGPSAEEQAAMADNARKTAGTLVQQLGGELKKTLEAQGPEGAIGVCKDKAPTIAASLSKSSGFDVKRVSPRNRNPKGVPDAWEAEAQAALEKRLAGGEKPETLETWQVVKTASGKEFRYAKALVTQPLCLTCHGENIPDGVKARLAAEYPGDKATGYSAGMVRGIISIKRPL